MNEDKLKNAINDARQATIDATKAVLDTDIQGKLAMIKELIAVEECLQKIYLKYLEFEMTSSTSLEELLDKEILRERTVKICERNGCLTVGDICNHTKEEILEFRNLGSRAFRELNDALNVYGFEIPETLP